MVLAALLLADGEWVTRTELAAGLFEEPTWPSVLSQHVRNLQRFGVPMIGRIRHRGYRLAVLPPDEHLDNMLACVPAVKRSAWWQTRLSQIPMTA